MSLIYYHLLSHNSHAVNANPYIPITHLSPIWTVPWSAIFSTQITASATIVLSLTDINGAFHFTHPTIQFSVCMFCLGSFVLWMHPRDHISFVIVSPLLWYIYLGCWIRRIHLEAIDSSPHQSVNTGQIQWFIKKNMTQFAKYDTK